jgi:hypothetical protein
MRTVDERNSGGRMNAVDEMTIKFDLSFTTHLATSIGAVKFQVSGNNIWNICGDSRVGCWRSWCLCWFDRIRMRKWRRRGSRRRTVFLVVLLHISGRFLI